jgi:mannose-6-phosphate isomerase-like protein (cupin superfamily)
MSRGVDAADGGAAAGAPILVPRTALTSSDDGPGMSSRWVRRPDPSGWQEPVISERQLRAAGWADLHPHTETNFVLAGQLYVQFGDVTVVATKGDSVAVLAGHVGRYWAPVFARMIAIYGPNPQGTQTETIEYWDISRGSRHRRPPVRPGWRSRR